MAQSKLQVDLYMPQARSAALAAALAAEGGKVEVEARFQGAGQCECCGVQADHREMRASWQSEGTKTTLAGLGGYCQDCTSVLDLDRDDLLVPERANAAAAQLAVVNDWSFGQAADYLQAEMGRADALDGLGVQMSYDTQAVAALAAPDVDLFAEPALDAAESLDDWATIGGPGTARMGHEVEEEIGELTEMETLPAIQEAQAPAVRASVITYVPGPMPPAEMPKPPVVVEVVQPAPQAAPVQPAAALQAPARVTPTSPASSPAQPDSRGMREKTNEATLRAAVNYYLEMTANTHVHLDKKARAAWKEAHTSTAFIQHVLWTGYHDLKLAGPNPRARSKVRIITNKIPTESQNHPTIAIIELNNQQWRLRVVNDYPGHRNQWELAMRSGMDKKWDALVFENEQAMMEYFAQKVNDQLAEMPRVLPVPSEESVEQSIS